MWGPIMSRITLHLADYFMEIFVNQIRALTECFEKRLLATFDGIEAEAKEISEREFERLRQSVGSYLEPDEIAEKAQEAGIEYYSTMDATRQGIFNMFTAACYHLFEQQLNKPQLTINRIPSGEFSYINPVSQQSIPYSFDLQQPL